MRKKAREIAILVTAILTMGILTAGGVTGCGKKDALSNTGGSQKESIPGKDSQEEVIPGKDRQEGVISDKDSQEETPLEEHGKEGVQKEEKVYLQVQESTVTGTGASFELVNDTGTEYWYGAYYTIEKLEEGEWRQPELKGEECWEDIAYILKPDSKNEIEYYWELWYGELSEGRYRLLLEVYEGKDAGNSTEVCAEFEITALDEEGESLPEDLDK